MPADFTPSMKGYSGRGAFRFWCQKVLPIVYDESLSYYELLGKVVEYLNNTIADVANVEDNVTALRDAFVLLQNYVNEYFDNLDVDEAVRNNVNTAFESYVVSTEFETMVDSFVTTFMNSQGQSMVNTAVQAQIGSAVGEQIGDVVSEQLPTAVAGDVTAWLVANVNPVGSAVTVDTSLTIAGSAADAKATGDELNKKADLPKIYIPQSYTTENSKIINQNGVVQSLSSTNNDYKVTNAITVESGDMLHITACENFGNSFYAFYDSSDVLVSKLTGEDAGSTMKFFDGTVIVPENATKLYVAYNSAVMTAVIEVITSIGVDLSVIPTISNSDRTTEGGLVWTATTNGAEWSKTGVKEIKDIIDDNFSPVWESIEGTTENGKYINASGEVTDISSGSWRVLTVNISEKTNYKVDASVYGTDYYFCAFYNADDTFISGYKAQSGSGSIYITEASVTSPANAVVMKISGTGTKPPKAQVITHYISNAKYKWIGKKWVVVGDSLTEDNIRTTKHYFNYVAEDTGISVYNMGDSGTGYARGQESNTAFYQRISAIPTDADVVTIFGSFNDAGAGIPLGTAFDTGTSTIGGCINTTLDNLFNTIPLAIVGIVTPTPWENKNPLTEPNDASAYVDLIVTICNCRSIPYLDLFHCSLLRPWEESFRALAYSKDDGNGVHPDETGHKIIAPRFKGFLETLLE